MKFAPCVSMGKYQTTLHTFPNKRSDGYSCISYKSRETKAEYLYLFCVSAYGIRIYVFVI